MSDAGLLIDDLQHGFSPCVDLVDRIREASTGYSMIVMTRFTNVPGSLYSTVLDWNDDGGELILCLPSAIVLEKSGYGLTAAHIETMKGLHDEWHVCGLETDACVLACAFTLWDAGLRPIILSELCASPLHSEALIIARRQFGDAACE